MTQAKTENALPRVAVILLNWNNFDDTIACIRSLRNVDYPRYEIVVVDNHSQDDSVNRLKQVQGIHLLQNNENLGFAGGNNVGIEFAMQQRVDYVLLLNNDTVVEKSFLTELVRRMDEDDTIGVIGGKIYYFDERNKIWSAGGGITRFTKRTFQYGENRTDKGQLDEEREVAFLSGCMMLIRRQVFDKIGLLDPDYFMYYEDVDFCLRAKNHYQVVYTPKAVIWHKVSATSDRSYRDYYRMRNNIWLLKKRYSFSTATIFLINVYIFIERLLRILVRKFILADKEKLNKRISNLIIGFKHGMNMRDFRERNLQSTPN